MREWSVVGQSETFAMVVLAYMFAASGFVSSGLSALLPTMLVQLGATPVAALFAGTLVGPAQVGARIVEAGWLARYHPLLSARLHAKYSGVRTALLGSEFQFASQHARPALHAANRWNGHPKILGSA